MIFVFGSNLAALHGKGAAKEAVERHGAIYGQGIGMQGKSYAIPTKDYNLYTLPLDVIEEHVEDFLLFAENNSDKKFFVTAIGCGLAGYTPEDIAPMFKGYPNNCILPKEFLTILSDYSIINIEE